MMPSLSVLLTMSYMSIKFTIRNSFNNLYLYNITNNFDTVNVALSQQIRQVSITFKEEKDIYIIIK